MSHTASSYEDIRIDVRSVVAAIWQRRFRILAVTLVLCVATYTGLQFLTPQYEATVSLLIEARDTPFTRPTSETQSVGGAGPDDAAIESQMQLVQSRETILRVIEAAGLRDEPEFATSKGMLGTLLSLVGINLGSGVEGEDLSADDRLVAILQSRLTVARERGSRVISIAFRSESPQRAARVANALAEAHVGRRADLVLSDTGDATTWLDTEIKKLRTKVTEAERAVADYKVNNDLFNGSQNTALVEQQLGVLANQISAATERRTTAQTKATLIREMLRAGQPVESIPDVRASPVVQILTEQKATAQAERAQQLSTFLPNHPNIKALDAQVAEIDKQIGEEGARIARAFESEAEIESGLEQSLRDELTRTKLSASDAQVNGVTLADLEREAAAQRDLLEAYLSRFREASSLTENRATFPDVRVVSSAAPPLRPAFPQTNLITVMVGFLAFAFQCGAIAVGELSAGRVLVSGNENRPGTDFAKAFASIGATGPEPDVAEDAEDELEAGHTPAGAFTGAVLAEAKDIARKIVTDKAALVIVSGAGRDDDRDMMDWLAGDLGHASRSVAMVDAGGGGRDRLRPGIAELSTGDVDMVDCVHELAEDLVIVPWGSGRLNAGSADIAVVVDALQEVYDHVLVAVGQYETIEELPDFGRDADLLVVAGALTGDDDEAQDIAEIAEMVGATKAMGATVPQDLYNVA